MFLRSSILCLAIVILAFPAAGLAGESLVNGSFEDGTINGWTILSDSLANYHNPPVTQCICGGDVIPQIPGSHKAHDLLLAPDGQYFAGLTWMQDVDPATHPRPGILSRYFQTIDVAEWNANADRTRYDFEIWSQMAHSWNWDRHGQAEQAYIIHWNNDGLAPRDTALVKLATDVYDGDTIEIDTSGVNRVYEFDVGDGIRPGSNVAVVVPNPTATVAITGGVLDGDTIEVDTSGINRVYEFDANGSVATGNVAVNVSSASSMATVGITSNVADGDTIEINIGGSSRVYEFDNNSTLRNPANVPVIAVGTYKTALNGLSAKINLEASSVPYTASGRSGNNITLTWGSTQGQRA